VGKADLFSEFAVIGGSCQLESTSLEVLVLKAKQVKEAQYR